MIGIDLTTKIWLGPVSPSPHMFRRPCDDDDLHVFPTAHHTTIANLTKKDVAKLDQFLCQESWKLSSIIYQILSLGHLNS